VNTGETTTPDSPRHIKASLFEEFARLGRSLSSSKRIELLDLLFQGERSVESLARLTGMGVTNTSQHLQTLRAARLVEVRKEGTRSLYRVSDAAVCTFLYDMQRLARIRLGEADRIARGYAFAPSLLWLMSGERKPQAISRGRERLEGKGIEFLKGEAEGLDPVRRTLRISWQDVSYERLVIALGAQPAPELMPGLEEGGTNIYTADGALEAGRALAELDGGRVVVVIAKLPYKCPAAPNEAAFLAEAMLRHRGVKADVALYSPEPFPMPTAGEAAGKALAGMLGERGIELHAGQVLQEVDAAKKELVFQGGERASYDLLLAVPPHRTAGIVTGSGLSNDAGFISVDPATLATQADGIYAIGDVTQIPIAGGRRQESSLRHRRSSSRTGSRTSLPNGSRKPRSMGTAPASWTWAMGSPRSPPGTSMRKERPTSRCADRPGDGIWRRSRSRSTGSRGGLEVAIRFEGEPLPWSDPRHTRCRWPLTVCCSEGAVAQSVRAADLTREEREHDPRAREVADPEHAWPVGRRDVLVYDTEEEPGQREHGEEKHVPSHPGATMRTSIHAIPSVPSSDLRGVKGCDNERSPWRSAQLFTHSQNTTMSLM
jgi:sulfide:quinone oxidoreductase